jgi:hypothetical protein
MKKQIIRLTEEDFHKVVRNSINKILQEINVPTWMKGNDSKYKQAVDVLSRHVLDYIEPEEIINNPDCVENEVEDSWQYVLNDDLLDAVYDRRDVACVTHKYCYGGGGFEVLRQLQMDVRDNVLNILKNEQSN